MGYQNPLDHVIHRFQDRWETNRQFRAAMSGVLGLVLLAVLCGGVGVVNALTMQALAAFGVSAAAGAGGHQNDSTGAQIVNGSLVFPTPSVTWTSAGVPNASPLANSLTPAPSPTPTATPTDVPTSGPCKTNCGGGGVTVTAAAVPAVWTKGLAVQITFHTSKPNDGINAFIHWSNGANWLSATTPGAPQQTDGSGNATWALTVPSDARCSTTKNVVVDYSAQSGGSAVYGPSLSIPCS